MIYSGLTIAPGGLQVCPGGKLFGRLVQRFFQGLHMSSEQHSLSSEHWNNLFDVERIKEIK